VICCFSSANFMVAVQVSVASSVMTR